MKKILIPILAVLLLGIYFVSCSNDNDKTPEVWQPDLAKFDKELNYNQTVLKIDGKEIVVDSCVINNLCVDYYYFKAFNERKEIILSFLLNRSNPVLDDIVSMLSLSVGGVPNLNSGNSKNSAIRIYKHEYKLNPVIYNETDSIYLDAVFHIQFEDDKEIKGQILIRDTINHSGYGLCM